MDMPPEVKEALPGISGSLTALIFLRYRWRTLVALFVCGLMAAKYLSPMVAAYMGTSAEIAGYVTGLFSMSITAKVFDTIHGVDGVKLVNDFLKRVKR